ncbi:hypothetical protein H0H92_014389 [Tricholoma furcatifolium]|nr:hypothetical protein H0H92_014389 [Tricholoma furcatifolium]
MQRNDLHPVIQPWQLSTYSSLEGAVDPARILYKVRRRLPQIKSDPDNKDTALYKSVNFDYRGKYGEGVKMIDLIEGTPNDLENIIEGAGEQVFTQSYAQSLINWIQLETQWPGYEGLQQPMYLTMKPNGNPITRAHLAVLISIHFSDILRKCRQQNSRAPNSVWDVRYSGIRFKDLTLVSLVPVCSRVWQADIIVDFPPQTVRTGPQYHGLLHASRLIKTIYPISIISEADITATEAVHKDGGVVKSVFQLRKRWI